ncbi:YfiM family protein [Pyxidicoccus sp. 3LG]
MFSGFSASAADGDDWLGADKAKHFAACLALSGAGYGAGALLFDASEARWLTGAGLAMGVGVGKEVYDARWGTTGFSAKDLAWDAAGTATGLAVSYLVDRFIMAGSRPHGPVSRASSGAGGGGVPRALRSTSCTSFSR